MLEGAGEVWDVAQQKTSCARLPQKSWGSLVANDASDLGWVRSGRACRLSAGRHMWQWGSLKDGNAYSFGFRAEDGLQPSIDSVEPRFGSWRGGTELTLRGSTEEIGSAASAVRPQLSSTSA